MAKRVIDELKPVSELPAVRAEQQKLADLRAKKAAIESKIAAAQYRASEKGFEEAVSAVLDGGLPPERPPAVDAAELQEQVRIIDTAIARQEGVRLHDAVEAATSAAMKTVLPEWRAMLRAKVLAAIQIAAVELAEANYLDRLRTLGYSVAHLDRFYLPWPIGDISQGDSPIDRIVRMALKENLITTADAKVLNG